MIRLKKGAPALSAALGACIAVLPSLAGATGQCSPSVPAEQYLHHPDYFPPFVAGKLGLVRREFTPEFLVPVYLTLSGTKLGAATQKQLAQYWADLHHLHTYADEKKPVPPDPEGQWKEARKKVRGAPLPESFANIYYGLNETCLKDSFRTALKTLQRVQGLPGVTAGDVAAWALAQDQVFSHCRMGTREPNPPAPLPVTASPVLRAERDYQIAAARFYAGDYPGAAAGFSRIAQDPASPWASWGTYLEARAHLRHGTLNNKPDELMAARPLLERVLQQAATPEMRKNARALLGFVQIRLEPGLRLRQLATELQRDHEGYLNDLRDYLFALARLPDPRNQGADTGREASSPRFQSDEREKLRRDSDLIDWMLTFNRPRGFEDLTLPGALEHSLERYQKTGSLPWLVAAISLVPPGHASARMLMDAAGKLTRSSPAYDTAIHHVLRLLQASSDKADRAAFARRVDAEIAARSKDPPSSLRNQLLDWRYELAGSLEESLVYSERLGLGDETCGFPFEASGEPPSLQQATRHMTDRLVRSIEREAPLLRIAALAAHPKLPAALRPSLAVLGFARGLLLGERDPAAAAIAARLEPQARALISEPVRKHLDAARAAATPEERRFYIALSLLERRTINPVSLSEDEGWCGTPLDSTQRSEDADRSRFSAADAKQAAAEHARLKELGNGSFALAVRWTLEYGKLHPEDQRLPEVLRDINQLSRSANCDATEWSKKAFLFMHKTYPQHPLTKKVKYWY